jgi:hypothetical protein
VGEEEMKIAVDFDGTCVKNNWPDSCKLEDIGAIPVLKMIANKGHEIILFTCRKNEKLEVAIKWFNDNEIPFTLPDWKEKPYYDLLIDDHAFGAPLNHVHNGEPFINWDGVRSIFIREEII